MKRLTTCCPWQDFLESRALARAKLHLRMAACVYGAVGAKWGQGGQRHGLCPWNMCGSLKEPGHSQAGLRFASHTTVRVL